MLNDATLSTLIAGLANYAVAGKTIWGKVCDVQRRAILDAWANGSLRRDMFSTTYGTDGAEEPNHERSFTEEHLQLYAAAEGITMRDLCERLSPVPDVGPGRRSSFEYQGQCIRERQAWGWHYARAVRRLCVEHGDGVCEIGGGVGYAAAYARRNGIGWWVSIDLAPSLVHQYLLLAPQFPVHVNEPVRRDAINLYDALTDYGLLLTAVPRVWMNTDSFPEMDPKVRERYIASAAALGARVFYSVNREPEKEPEKDCVSRTFRAAGWRCVSEAPFPRQQYLEQVWEAPSSATGFRI